MTRKKDTDDAGWHALEHHLGRERLAGTGLARYDDTLPLVLPIGILFSGAFVS
jgi:hypothetical protein